MRSTANKEYDIAKNFINSFKLRQNKQLNESYEYRPQDKIDDMEGFKALINATIEFGNHYVKNNKIYFHGVIKFSGDGILVWEFNNESTDGFFLTTEKLKINDEILGIITQMKLHYGDWKAKWNETLNG